MAKMTVCNSCIQLSPGTSRENASPVYTLQQMGMKLNLTESRLVQGATNKVTNKIFQFSQQLLGILKAKFYRHIYSSYIHIVLLAYN